MLRIMLRKLYLHLRSSARRAYKYFSFRVIDNVHCQDPELIAVCNPNFSLGVKSATYSLSEQVFEVSEIITRGHARSVARRIALYKPKRLLISGYALGYDLLAEEAKKAMPETEVLVYIHSAFIWFDFYPEENHVFEKMLELARVGVIRRIAFCKRDLAEYFKCQGLDTCFVMNRFDMPTDVKARKLEAGKIKIGIWGANLWHRNILNQVIAALMVPGAEIHVNEINDHHFLDRTRIIEHGILPKKDFDRLFLQMDINLYVSLTDCFPMTLVESLAKGIPAIASDTSDVYAFNVRLKNMLVVSTVDGPLGISKKINEVIADYTNIQKEIGTYLPKLKQEVEASIEEFLNK